MQHKYLNIHSHPLTSYFLDDAFILENDFNNEEYFIIPKGQIGVYFIMEGNGSYNYTDQKLRLPQAFISGLINKPVHSIISKKYKAYGFRFKPEFLQLIVLSRISDFRLRPANLYDLFYKDSVEKLMEMLITAKNEYQIIGAFNSFLEQHYKNYKIDQRIQDSLSIIRNLQVSNVEQISELLNISSTTLRTLFNEHVGTSPKALIKLYRINNALTFNHASLESLTQLSYSLGYYDQSHFIHEFKSVFGITPLQYFSNAQLAFDFYNFDRWRLSSFASK